MFVPLMSVAFWRGFCNSVHRILVDARCLACALGDVSISSFIMLVTFLCCVGSYTVLYFCRCCCFSFCGCSCCCSVVVLFAFVVLVIVVVVVAAVVLVAIIVATIILAVVPLFGVMVGSVWSPACVYSMAMLFIFVAPLMPSIVC